MKPADFDYFAPGDLDAALELVASSPSDTRVLAGGQSLLPLMKARLVSPATVVDLGRVEGLDRIELCNGALQLGAMTSQSRALGSETVRTCAPLLARALGLVGSPAIRSRGTVGGSAVHADPAAEIAAVLIALDATLVAAGPGRTTEIPAASFYTYAYETSLPDGEIVTRLDIPAATHVGDTGVSFHEIAIPSHNFALAGAAVSVTIDDGTMRDVRIGLCGLGPTPLRACEAEALAEGSTPSRGVIDRISRAATSVIDPVDDVLASASYRRDLAPVVVRRALVEALADTGSFPEGVLP